MEGKETEMTDLVDKDVERIPVPMLKSQQSRAHEKNLLEKRQQLIESLIEENKVYSTHLSEIREKQRHGEKIEASKVKENNEKSSEHQRRFCSLFTQLEEKDGMWEKNSDPFEALRECVGERHKVLKTLVATAEECVELQKQGDTIESRREQSERLHTKLDRLNSTITALEIRCRSETKAEAELTEMFNNYASKKWEKDKEEKDVFTAEEPVMSLDRFKNFWKKFLGVKLDEKKYNKFRADMKTFQVNVQKAPSGEKFQELVQQTKDGWILTLPNELVSARVFIDFLRLRYGISPDEGVFLIKDHKSMAEHRKTGRRMLCRCGLFACVWVFLLFVLFLQFETSDRFWQTYGARQVLTETVWNDIQFADINSVGLFWMYMNTIALPFAYGTLEWGYDLQVAYEADVFDTVRMNPYLLGGVRMRTIRHTTEECEKPADKAPYKCVSEEEDESDWTKWADVPPINQVLKWHEWDSAELDEQFGFIGKTKTFKGNGYYWDFPPLTEYNKPSTAAEISKCENLGVSLTAPMALCNATEQLFALRDNFFVDAQTRAIIIDMNFFGPSTKLHTLGRIVFEFRFGSVIPFDSITTWDFFLYEDTKAYVVYFFFILAVACFTAYHMYDCWRYMETLGFPICCFCVKQKLTAQQAKLPERMRIYQLEKLKDDEKIRFMKYNLNEEESAGLKDPSTLLLIPIDGITPLRVQQKQQVILNTIADFLRRERLTEVEELEPRFKVEYEDCISTDWGGTLLYLRIENDFKGHVIFPDDEDELEEIFKAIGTEIELELKESVGFEETNVLVSTDPTFQEKFFGHGFLLFYRVPWNVVDLILIFCFWVYILTNLATFPSFDLKEMIQVNKFHSLRSQHSDVNVQANGLFLVVFISSFKLLEFLQSVNRQVRLFNKMLMGSIKVLLSFFLLFAFFILTFTVSGWLIFSSEIWEFRTFYDSYLSLVRWSVYELPYEELQAASVLGSPYYFMWYFIMSLILINVFVAILLNAWETVAEESNNERKSAAWFPQLSQFFGWRPNDDAGDPKADWLEEPAQWRRVYPAGCPDRRLRDYLKNQLDLDDKDCEDVMNLIDVDKSGTIDWNELTSVLMDLRPNIENRTFVMRRKQTQQVLTEQQKIQQEIHDLDMDTLEKDKKIKQSFENINAMLAMLEKK